MSTSADRFYTSDDLILEALSSLCEEDTKNDIKKQHHIVPKNDIRRYIPILLSNALNSSDENVMLNFLSAFMKDNSKCTIRNDIKSIDILPRIMHLTGPWMFIHYYIGMGVMFPDMVFVPQSYRITTYGNSMRTQLKMNFEFKSTHVANILFDLWIPPQHSLDHLYNTLDQVILEEQLRNFRFSLAVPNSASRVDQLSHTSTECSFPQVMIPQKRKCESFDGIVHSDDEANTTATPSSSSASQSVSTNSTATSATKEGIISQIIFKYFHNKLTEYATPLAGASRDTYGGKDANSDGGGGGGGQLQMHWCVEVMLDECNKIEWMLIHATEIATL